MPKKWNLLSNHGLVITYIAQNPKATLREIARVTDLTERAVYQIVRDLETDGFIKKQKTGRRNSYIVVQERVLTFPVYKDLSIQQLASTVERLSGK
ncbi:MAG TPA: winged helix-turn-helix transcriptional regulator [Dehalococcoidia bacterium]|nr:winged helix-turn-helix transcriptional regulator [Dehalococcoidia bacterium]